MNWSGRIKGATPASG